MHTRRLEELKKSARENAKLTQDGSSTMTQLLENLEVLKQLEEIKKLLQTTKKAVADMPSFDLGIPRLHEIPQPEKQQPQIPTKQVDERRSKRHQDVPTTTTIMLRKLQKPSPLKQNSLMKESVLATRSST